MIEIKNRYTGEVIKAVDAPDLSNANLSKANLRDADLRGANLSDADLRGANLSNADLSNADLNNADLRRSDLRGAGLSGADLRRTNLRGASLSKADLSGADLRVAYLRYANLRYADLRGADLRGADLRYADPSDAVLRYAKLPTGELWEVYCREVVPALLSAGGRPVPPAAWRCHDWANCLIACAFSAHSLDQVPALYRPRAEQLIQFFDAGLLDHLAPPLPEDATCAV